MDACWSLSVIGYATSNERHFISSVPPPSNAREAVESDQLPDNGPLPRASLLATSRGMLCKSLQNWMKTRVVDFMAPNDPEMGTGHALLIYRKLRGNDALDIDLVLQVARAGKIIGQLHAKPCFERRAECF